MASQKDVSMLDYNSNDEQVPMARLRNARSSASTTPNIGSPAMPHANPARPSSSIEGSLSAMSISSGADAAVPPVFRRVYKTSSRSEPNWNHKQRYSTPVGNNTQAQQWFEWWQKWILQRIVERIKKGASTQYVHAINLKHGTAQVSGRPKRQIGDEKNPDVQGISLSVHETPDYQTSRHDTKRRAGVEFSCPKCKADFRFMKRDDIIRHHKTRHEQPKYKNHDANYWLKHQFRKIIVVYRDSGYAEKSLDDRLETVRGMVYDLRRLFLVPFPVAEAQVAIMADHVRSVDVPTFYHDPDVENALAVNTFIFRNFNSDSTRQNQILYASNADLMTRTILAELEFCYETEQVPLLVFHGVDAFSSHWNRMVQFFREYNASCSDLDIVLAAGAFETGPDSQIRKACPMASGQHYFGRYYASHIVNEADGVQSSKPIKPIYANGIRAWKEMCDAKFEANTGLVRNAIALTGARGRNR
ncbi:hypothetical protein KCU93_g9786, partial [Aureobasidium melanogenum]